MRCSEHDGDGRTPSRIADDAWTEGCSGELRSPTCSSASRDSIAIGPPHASTRSADDNLAASSASQVLEQTAARAVQSPIMACSLASGAPGSSGTTMPPHNPMAKTEITNAGDSSQKLRSRSPRAVGHKWRMPSAAWDDAACSCSYEILRLDSASQCSSAMWLG